MRLIFYTLFFTFFFFAISITNASAAEYFNGKPQFIQFDKNDLPAIEQLNSILSNYGLKSPAGLQLIGRDSDKLGMVHFRYCETYNNYPVDQTMLMVHTKNGLIESMNGVLYTTFPSTTTITINESIARHLAVGYIHATVFNDTSATAELYWVINKDNGQMALCYRFDIYATAPLSRKYIFVDANSGSVLNEHNRINEIDAPGTAVTVYSGIQPITTDSYNGAYRLREAGRGGGIETYDLNQGANYGAATDFTDADNYWNNVNANLDQYATDAHWGAEKTYDYYYNTYGRNSVDNAGLKLLSYVHYSTNYVNAFWDGTKMTYGDGDSYYAPLTALDITGHEISHGLTQYTAALQYLNESGALNESFSDCMGTAIEWYAKPATANWLIGSDIGLVTSTEGGLRNMADPKQFQQPNTYLGQYWYTGASDYGGVHTNSGVMNYWFYLVSVGGSGTNDIGNNYSVNGVTIQEAAAIAYRMQTVYLFPTAQYEDARTWSIQAAIDLYGACSKEVIAVSDAWYAVGLGKANFVASLSLSSNAGNTICSGTSVTFTATVTNPGTGPVYQWKINGVNVGTNSLTYTTNTLTNGAKVSCTMTSSASCLVGSPVVADSIVMIVNPVASVSITTNVKNPICSGVLATFTAHEVNGGTNPVYQWKKNGVNVGTNDSVYSATQFSNNDQVSCVITSNAPCVTGSPATSNTITMVVNPTGTELVYNGDFSQGNTGFTTTYTYCNSANCLYPLGNDGYAIGTNPNYFHNVFQGADHTTGTGNMMIINGSDTDLYVWQQSVIVQANTGYLFSLWLCSVDNLNPGGLNLFINGTKVGSISAPTVIDNWVQFSVLWNSGTNTTATLLVKDQGSIWTGADYGLDDISLKRCCGTITGPPQLNFSICKGDSVQLSSISGTAYSWSPSRGLSKSSSASPKASPASTTTYTVSVTTPCQVVSSEARVVVDSTFTEALTISSNATTICTGSLVNFTAVPVNGGSSPSYQWKVNGINAGTNSPAFSSSTLTNNALVSCVMTTGQPCAKTDSVTSNTITITVNPIPMAVVSITANPGTTICSGTPVTFTANATNGGSNPFYQWKLNGANVGLNSSTFTASSLANGDIIKCTLISSLACVDSNPARSNILTITIATVGGIATANITTPSDTICSGKPVSFKATSNSGTNNTTYQWKVNGQDAGQNDSLFTTNTLNNGDTVSCVVNWISSCLTGLPVTTNSIILSVLPGANAGIIISPRDTICVGTGDHLKLQGNSPGKIQWQSSSTSNSFTDISSADTTFYSFIGSQTIYFRVIDGNNKCADTTAITRVVIEPDPLANFTDVVSGKQVTFNSSSSSSDIIRFSWDFADGNTSTDPDPAHVYDTVKTYYVCLTGYNGSNCSFTYCKYIDLQEPNGIVNLSANNSLIIAPNPFEDNFYVHLDNANASITGVELYDVLGRCRYNKIDAGENSNTFQLKVPDLANGIYYLFVRTSETSYVVPVVKQ